MTFPQYIAYILLRYLIKNMYKISMCMSMVKYYVKMHLLQNVIFEEIWQLYVFL